MKTLSKEAMDVYIAALHRRDPLKEQSHATRVLFWVAARAYLLRQTTPSTINGQGFSISA